MKTANAPLFKDPIHNGAADPVVIYKKQALIICFTPQDAQTLKKKA